MALRFEIKIMKEWLIYLYFEIEIKCLFFYRRLSRYPDLSSFNGQEKNDNKKKETYKWSWHIELKVFSKG